MNQGLIELFETDHKEQISLSKKGYVPAEDFEEKLFFAGKNIGDHLSVVVHNLENRTPSMFDRAVYYTKLSATSVQTIEETSKTKMMAALTEINQLASELQTQDKQAENADQSMHVGAYFHHQSSESK